MRFSTRFGLGFAVAALLLAGCKPAVVEEPPVASWHFAGSRQLPQLADAPGLKLVTATPTADAAGAALASRLAHTLWYTVTGNTNAPADAVAAAVPLLRELIGTESAGSVFSTAGAQAEFGFSARLDAARVGPWREGMVKFFAAARGGDIGVWVGHTNGVLTVAFPATASAKALALSSRLGSWPANSVLEADLNLPKWTRSPWPEGVLATPRAHVIAVATNKNVRTTATLTFPEPLKLELDAWQLPTALINGQIRGLTAVRGLRPLLEKAAWFKALNSGAAPNQATVWMLPFDSLQTYFALPVAEPERLLAGLYTNYSPILSGSNAHVMGSLVLTTNSQRLWVNEFPVPIPPMMMALRTNNAAFVAGGFMLSKPSTNPIPAVLLEQLAKPDLVAYSWEITEDSIKHWRTLAQLRGIVFHEPPVAPKAAGQVWLDEQIPKLGNTVTEVRLTAPGEIRIVRSGPAGLAGMELVALTRWIDGPAALQLPKPGRPGAPGGPAVPAPVRR